MVIFADTEIERAVEATIKGCLTNGGQICTAHTRLIVQEGIKDRLIKKLKNAFEKIPYCSDPITERERGDRAWETGMTDVIQPVVSASQHENHWFP